MGCFALLWDGHSYFGVVHLRCMHNYVQPSASKAGVLLVCCNVIVIILNQLMNIGKSSGPKNYANMYPRSLVTLLRP